MVAACGHVGGVENSCLLATEFQLWVLKYPEMVGGDSDVNITS